MSDQITPKEKVLKKLRKALLQKDVFFKGQLDFDSDVFVREGLGLAECFAENFIRSHGKFIYCNNQYQFLDRFFALAEDHSWSKVVCLEESFRPWLESCGFPFYFHAEDAKIADVGITGCDSLIARTGSIMLSSKSSLSRAISIYPPVHIVIAYRNQLKYGLKEYFQHTEVAQSSMHTIITGPSRTSDIERTLVLGAHGPKELYLFYIDQDKEA